MGEGSRQIRKVGARPNELAFMKLYLMMDVVTVLEENIIFVDVVGGVVVVWEGRLIIPTQQIFLLPLSPLFLPLIRRTIVVVRVVGIFVGANGIAPPPNPLDFMSMSSGLRRLLRLCFQQVFHGVMKLPRLTNGRGSVWGDGRLRFWGG